MTDPWKGVEERRIAQKTLQEQALQDFAKEFKPENYCRHLKVCSKSKSMFQCKGITCDFMKSAICHHEVLLPNDAKCNCHKNNSTCPNFEDYQKYQEKLEEERRRQEKEQQLLDDYEYNFDEDTSAHRDLAEKELATMNDEKLHELYDFLLSKVKEQYFHKKEFYQIKLLSQYPIQHKQNILLNALRHTNEYSNRIRYTTYVEMKDSNRL